MGGIVSAIFGGGDKPDYAAMQAEAEARAEARAKKEREEAARKAAEETRSVMRARGGRAATILTDERSILNAGGLLR